MSKCWMVNVDGEGVFATSSAAGELFFMDSPETHLASRKVAETAAELVRQSHPDCSVRVVNPKY